MMARLAHLLAPLVLALPLAAGAAQPAPAATPASPSTAPLPASAQAASTQAASTQAASAPAASTPTASASTATPATPDVAAPNPTGAGATTAANPNFAMPPSAPVTAPAVGTVRSPIVGSALPTAAPTAGLLQTLLALIAVLAVLGALAWFLKRYGPRAAGGSAHLRIVGALNLGGRERLLVVEVGDQWIVVGAAPGRVNGLATMPKQDAAEPGATLLAPTPAASNFGDWLKHTLDKRKQH